jgi:glycosyltransferase involved in cell wall biosynthesis
MKIIINGQTFHTAERFRGIGRYLSSTLDELLKLDNDNHFIACTLQDIDPSCLSPLINERVEFINLSKRRSRGGRFRYGLSLEQQTQLALIQLFEEQRPDLYWDPNPLMLNVVFPARVAGCSSVATIFDLIPLKFDFHYFKNWTPEIRTEYVNRLTRGLCGFDRLLAISYSTKADIVDFLSMPDRRIEVVHLGVDDKFFLSVVPGELERVQRKYSISKDFVIYVGGFDFRKNMEGLVKGFSRFLKKYQKDVQLLIVCGYDACSYEGFLTFLRRENLENIVRLVGQVTDDDLRALYKLAKTMIFPSLCEGFGLPVVEAMACGTPVVASMYSSFPEVLKDAALYFDPYSSEDMADRLNQMLYIEDRFAFVEKGLRLVRGLTWRSTAERTFMIFERLVDRSSREVMND